ncbi:uncharacterized protein A4U43_C05F22500 [Asparagus officinalis]|uniref:RING-type E3 ubiquitin transferase n=1 Tax=Asparagus officinalis TaxID=4686 RepID=A0A5P1EUC0_ASPOF|nr:E3 ubiquitin-protein ligase CIP8-like [Asparagus officinalis]ONK69404.1 uncharacterized protein A4U43_C05F22500 [Asparagus officinalis]
MEPLPVFWSLSPPSPRSTSPSRSEPDRDQDPPTLSLSLFNLPDNDMDLGLGQDPNHGDWGVDDEFFIGRRFSSSYGSESESSRDFSRARPIDRDGLRILAFESDSDSDEQIVAIGEDSVLDEQIEGDASVDLPLCWDCLRIDDERRDLNAEFEWEEVDGRVEEREVINLNQEGVNDEERASNVEWEVLWMNHLGNNDDSESYLDDGFVYATSDYDEVQFAQFQGHHDSLLKGSPPAAKLVVESLPSVFLTKDHVEINGCAVCKDEISAEEKAKMLPCSHCYHEECILPWLKMRNTCPLCRFELPTDDPEYERWKLRRTGSTGRLEVAVDERIRYDFEILPDA